MSHPIGLLSSSTDITNSLETYWVHPIFFDLFLQSPYMFVVSVASAEATPNIEKDIVFNDGYTVEKHQEYFASRIDSRYKNEKDTWWPILQNITFHESKRIDFSIVTDDQLPVYQKHDKPTSFEFVKSFKTEILGNDSETLYVVGHDRHKSLVHVVWGYSDISYSPNPPNTNILIEEADTFTKNLYVSGWTSTSNIIGFVRSKPGKIPHIETRFSDRKIETYGDNRWYAVYAKEQIDLVKELMDSLDNGNIVKRNAKANNKFIISNDATFTSELFSNDTNTEFYELTDEEKATNILTKKTTDLFNQAVINNNQKPFVQTVAAGSKSVQVPGSNTTKQTPNQSSTTTFKKQVGWLTVKPGVNPKNIVVFKFTNNKLVQTQYTLSITEKIPVYEVVNFSGQANLGATPTSFTRIFLISASENKYIRDLSPQLIFEDLISNIEISYNQQQKSTNTEAAWGAKFPQFEPNLHVRPVLQIVHKGQTINMYLRVTSFQASYNNQFSPMMSNAGWYIQVSSSALATFVVNGFFLDTKTNQEFEDFMKNYRKYITAYRDDNYLSSAICNFFYRGKQYRCLIASFNYSKSEGEFLYQRFSMQLMVLKEEGWDSAVQIPTSKNAELNKPLSFSSYTSTMLMNPVTAFRTGQ
jgi:hypothetical protein